MPTDLDPIAVLGATDPADAAPVPAPPAVDELASVAAAARPGPPTRRARIVALAAAVLLVVAVVGTALAVASDGEEGSTSIATSPDGAEPPSPADGDVLPAPEDGADGEPLDDVLGVEPLGGGPVQDRPELDREPFVQGEPPAPIGLAEPEPARPHLLALADRAATDTAPADPGAIAYQRFVTWNRNDSGFTMPIPESAQRETWTGPEDDLVEEGEGPPVRRGEVVQTELDPPLPADAEPVGWDDAYIDPPGLVDPATIDLFLQVEFGPASDFQYCLERAGEILGGRPRTGAERAAVLRRLAEIDAFRYRGEVVDRAGRPSLAFSAQTDVHGGLDEVVILLDAETGAMNGREDLQLEGGGVQAGDEPLLRWSQTILAVAHVDALGERP